MAYSSLAEHLKKFNILEKRSDAAIQTYATADERSWTANKIERSILLHDIITRPSSQQTYRDGGDIDISGISKNECIKKMAELRKELDEMHDLYKKASEKIEALEGVAKESRKSQMLLKDSEAKLKAQENIIEDLKSGNSEEYEKLLRERDSLCEQLKKAESLGEIRKKFKARADEADRMEEEIANLKRELEKCKKSSGPSGDKIKSDSSCCNCEGLIDELEGLKKKIEVEEKRSTDSMAERNFLRQKTRTIDLLEAELILYKSKYEECECKIRALKEVICKNESAERLSKQSLVQLKDTESRLMEAECENDCLIKLIERLNMNLKERDVYIESLTKRLNEDLIPDGPITAKKAISYESIASGTVGEIVKRLSNSSTRPSKCKCNVSNCKCGQISGCRSATTTKSSHCAKFCASKKSLRKALSRCSSKASEPTPTKSEIDAMQIDKLLDEIRLLRGENCELEKELKRVKNDLAQMSSIVDEVEKQRKSNEELQGELSDIKSNFNEGISQMSSKYQAKVSEKIIELTDLESKLQIEKEKASCLEKKVCEICQELSHLKGYREKCGELQKSLNCISNDHYEKAREAEIFKKDCQEYFKENQQLKCEIEELKCEVEELKCQIQKMKEKPNNQREIIKKSVIEFKRHYDEKLQLIRCYEEKIRSLEEENDTLKCSLLNQPCDDDQDDILTKAAKFSLASLESDELLELHNKIKRVMTGNPNHVTIHNDYSKLFDDICEKYNFNNDKPVRDDFDNCSACTAPTFRSRAPKKSCLKPVRSKSSDLCKKSFREKRKRMQSQ